MDAAIAEPAPATSVRIRTATERRRAGLGACAACAQYHRIRCGTLHKFSNFGEVLNIKGVGKYQNNTTEDAVATSIFVLGRIVSSFI